MLLLLRLLMGLQSAKHVISEGQSRWSDRMFWCRWRIAGALTLAGQPFRPGTQGDNSHHRLLPANNILHHGLKCFFILHLPSPLYSHRFVRLLQAREFVCVCPCVCGGSWGTRDSDQRRFKKKNFWENIFHCPLKKKVEQKFPYNEVNKNSHSL